MINTAQDNKIKLSKYIVLFSSFFFGMMLFADGSEFCPVGEPGANADPKTGRGFVAEEFEIMKFEVTNKMYCDFLNEVASLSDPCELYTRQMSEHFWGGIERRENADGSCHYTCKPGYEELPVVFVNWYDAARYANYLHWKSLGKTAGALTEGTAESGAYDTRAFPPNAAGTLPLVRRNPGARYFLPSYDEWYKAAFYGGNGRYFRYATQSDEVPSATPGQIPGANYYANRWAVPFPHLTAVGFWDSPGYFGTFDQGGNVAEWIECPRGEFQLAVGGSLIRPEKYLRSDLYEGDYPNKKLSTFGFRLARAATSAEQPDQPGEPPASKPGIGRAASASSSSEAVSAGKGGDYVLVGDPGNPPDVFYGGFGAVNYPYEIGRCEISNQEWVDFLNAVAGRKDPHGLFHPDQESGVLGGILRIRQEDGTYIYRAKSGWENRPVSYISFYSLARYANFLHYGKPKGDAGEFGVTEGDAEQGAYDTREFELVRSGRKKPDADFGRRNPGAKYFIPNQNEWYKAAYYDPTKPGARKYHDYPNRSSDLPDNPAPERSSKGVNYQKGDHLAQGAPYYLAPVDAYPDSSSYYGTLQQGGNVWEWQEDWQYGVVGVRGLRGGSFGYTELGLHASNCDPGGIDEISYVFGGRFARRVEGTGNFPDMPWKVRCYWKLKQLGLSQWGGIVAGCCLASFVAGIVAAVVLCKIRRKFSR